MPFYVEFAIIFLHFGLVFPNERSGKNRRQKVFFEIKNHVPLRTWIYACCRVIIFYDEEFFFGKGPKPPKTGGENIFIFFRKNRFFSVKKLN
jgi:hypothetical protein